ncbi:Tyrosine-protein phosphatase 1 [Trichinella nelsoni]|uniref:Tyrosine-protein phosphatase 1 n=2 Tax=Trichinella nelsoni TaxID=6336 RepID=A0A0V0RKP4_9BILA|nr:Tyrosine-protein phosphatase 1 [Trichinella nelsoni]
MCEKVLGGGYWTKSKMPYCPPNVTFYTVWYDRGFNPCFIDSVVIFVLGTMMLTFGCAELAMYIRHGTRLSQQLLNRLPKMYIVQVCFHVILLFIPVILTILHYAFNLEFYGYIVLYNIVFVCNWATALLLLFMERNYDLPSTPARGHSITLNLFWGLSFALESAVFVNFNSQRWFFIVKNYEDRILLCMFILKWILLLSVFVIGMVAPGMISTEARGQFEYKTLVDETITSTVFTTDVDSSDQFNDIRKIFKDALYSGEYFGQFQELQPYGEGMTFNTARERKNRFLNRYTNVLPYDHNRVILNNNHSKKNDYINASFVNVRLADTDICLNYIATQAPMENTVDDFWQMIWEQNVHTVVMLTDLYEGDVEKCYCYFPEVNQTLETNHLIIGCVGDEVFGKCRIRDFYIINVDTEAELNVSHLQFLGWPDHGVPDKPQLFLDFFSVIKRLKPENMLLYSSDEVLNEQTPPIVVHCSAGIGRTGVYILTETLMRMLEAQVYVNPVEIVKYLRNSRMGMVQTEQQLSYACKVALLYSEKCK